MSTQITGIRLNTYDGLDELYDEMVHKLNNSNNSNKPNKLFKSLNLLDGQEGGLPHEIIAFNNGEARLIANLFCDNSDVVNALNIKLIIKSGQNLQMFTNSTENTTFSIIVPFDIENLLGDSDIEILLNIFKLDIEDIKDVDVLRNFVSQSIVYIILQTIYYIFADYFHDDDRNVADSTLNDILVDIAAINEEYCNELDMEAKLGDPSQGINKLVSKIINSLFYPKYIIDNYIEGKLANKILNSLSANISKLYDKLGLKSLEIKSKELKNIEDLEGDLISF